MKTKLLIGFKFFRKNLEAFIWIAALISLAFLNPENEQHYSFCVFHNLGFKYCPGCGLGHSISCFFRGDLQNSFYAHPLGIIAVIILITRIIQIFRNSYKKSSSFVTGLTQKPLHNE